MSIYDIIANPQNPIGQGLQIIDSMQNRKEQRTLMRLQASEILRKREAEKSAAESRAKGRDIIRGVLTGGTTTGERQQTNIVPELWNKTNQGISEAVTEGPKEATPKMMQSAMNPIIESVKQIPMRDIDEVKDYGELADRLASIPGMEETAKMFYDLDARIEQADAERTDAQKKESREIFEAMSNPMREVAQLEEQNDIVSAEQKYSQLKEFILNDPRFNENEDIRKFYKMFPDYRPGLGKYMYMSAMTREQMQKEQPTPGKPQIVNLLWPGLDRPVKGKFENGEYLYEKDGQWTKAPANAEVLGRTRITGTTEEATGLTKTNITKTQDAIGKRVQAVDKVKNVLEGVKKNPQAIGIQGAAREFAAGVIGQVWAEGAEKIESKEATRLRSDMRMLQGEIIPIVTGDTSGRYSNMDVERAEEVNRGLKFITSQSQYEEALKSLLDTFENGRIRDEFAMKYNKWPTAEEFAALKYGSGKKEKKSDYSHLWGD